MKRLTCLLFLAGLVLTLAPAPASAQFGLGNPNFGGPSIVPSFNPFFYVPQYRYQSYSGLNVGTMYGNFSLSTRQYYYGVNNPALALTPAYPGYYSQGGSSMSGNANVRPNLALEAQRDLARAQREMSRPGAYSTTDRAPRATTTAPATASVDRGPDLPDGFGKALAPADRARVLSGEALNDLLGEIAKAEPKGGNRPSAFVTPLQLEDVRFNGSDAADVLNLALHHLDLPVAFDDPAVKDLRLDLHRDFAPVVTALQAGKLPEPAARAQLEITLKKLDTALAPVVKKLSPADATAANSFMSQMANAAKALKAGAVAGLIDPKWATEGTTVADLARHMARHKLGFAAAPNGNEESYTAMHRNLATYLFLLTQPKK